jgi:hypothetical protein
MLKIVAMLVVLMLSFGIRAQDLKTAASFYTAKEYVKAKSAIDKALSSGEANNPVAWIWKHKIYYALSTGASAASFPNGFTEGFEALKKARQLPKGEEALMIEIGLDVTQTFYTYYTAFINNGSSMLNKEDYSNAYSNFVQALAVSDYFYQQKLIPSAVDTQMLFYAGYTAMKGNDFTNAEKYFKTLSDHDCSGTDLQISYGWLTNYYIEKKKNDVAKAVCDKGLRFYPGAEYLRSKKLELERLTGNTQSLFKSYEDIIASGKAAFTDYLAYGAELYDYLYNSEANVAVNEKAALQKRLEEMLTKALQLRNGSAQANYLMGMYYTGRAMENQNSNLTAAEADADKSIGYLDKAVNSYLEKTNRSASDKTSLTSALTQLINLYAFRGKKELKAAAALKLEAIQ